MAWLPLGLELCWEVAAARTKAIWWAASAAWDWGCGAGGRLLLLAVWALGLVGSCCHRELRPWGWQAVAAARSWGHGAGRQLLPPRVGAVGLAGSCCRKELGLGGWQGELCGESCVTEQKLIHLHSKWGFLP